MVAVIRLLDDGHWSCLDFAGTASSCKGRQRPRSIPKSREMCLLKKRSNAKGLLCRIHTRSHENICACVHLGMSIMSSSIDYNLLDYSHCLISFWGWQQERGKQYQDHPNSSKIRLLIISEDITRVSPDHVFGCFCYSSIGNQASRFSNSCGENPYQTISKKNLPGLNPGLPNPDHWWVTPKTRTDKKIRK